MLLCGKQKRPTAPTTLTRQPALVALMAEVAARVCGGSPARRPSDPVISGTFPRVRGSFLDDGNCNLPASEGFADFCNKTGKTETFRRNLRS